MSATPAEGKIGSTILYGIYTGVIEYVNDPIQKGRVKVRIPSLHGTINDIETKDLPWAVIMTPFGGGYDYGTKTIPPVGTSVFVQFAAGNVFSPIVIGMWNAIDAEPRVMLRNRKKDQPQGPISMSEKPDEPWMAPPGPDAPKEFLQQVGNRPERHVVFKSVKGATFDIEDRDEVEATRLVDRAGQGLFMDSPIRAVGPDTSDGFPSNKANAAQRGLRNAKEGDQLPIESTLNKEARVVLVDIGAQSIVLNTKENSNSIRITSKQGDVDPDTKGIISGNMESPGKSNVNMELSGGDGVFTLEIVKDGILKALIKMDGDSEVLEISSPLLTKITSETILLQGDVSVEGNLTVNNTLTVGENGFFGEEVISSKNAQKVSLQSVENPSYQ